MSKYTCQNQPLPAISRHSVFRALALVGLIACWAIPMQAQTISVALHGYGAVPLQQSETSGSVFLDFDRSFTPSTLRAHGLVSFGWLGVYTESIHPVWNTTTEPADGISQGLSDDVVTIDAPGRTGQTGVLTFKILTTGSLLAETERTAGQGGFSNYASITLLVSTGIGPDAISCRRSINVRGEMTVAGPDFLNQEVTGTIPFTFGQYFGLKIGLTTQANTADVYAERCIADAATNWNGITSVADSNGTPISDYTVTSASGTNYQQPVGPPPKKLWAAGRDLSLNETADQVAEENAVNQTVPEWSYGFRSTQAGTSLTLFQATQHQNGVGNSEVDGWIPGAGVLINTGSVPVTVDLGGGASSPVRPGQLIMQPTATEFAVARWTAPDTGTYNIAARWVDLENGNGNGASGHVVVNGVEVFGGQASPGSTSFNGARWANGGKVAMPPKSFRLEAGATVDFVVGANGDAAADLTAVNAIVRRAPTVTISAPTSAVEGENIVVSVTSGVGLSGAALRKDGMSVGVDREAPFEFNLQSVTPGVYHLQAEGIDADGVLGASNVVILTVGQAVARPGSPKTNGAFTGSTYECITSGNWSMADIWHRTSDGGSGVPGPNDIAILPASVQVVLSEDTTVKKLFCQGIIAGESGTTNRVLTVTKQFGISGLVRDLTVTIPEGGLLTNVRGSAFFENVNVLNRGQMVISQSLFALGCQVTSTGLISLLTPPASGGPVLLQAGRVNLGGLILASPGTAVVANTLVGQDGGSLVGQDGSTLVGQDGGTLVGNDGAGLVGQDGGTLVGQDGGTLVGNDGAGLVGQDGGTLVGNDGAGLGAINAAALVGQDGGTRNAPRTLGLTPDGTPPAASITLNRGTVSGTCNLVGNVAINGSFVVPGSPTGAISVAGNYTQNSESTLVLEIGGTQQSQSDRLNVSGVANLGGSLIVRTIHDFIPQPGDTIQPLTYGSVIGNFASVSSNAQITLGATGTQVTVTGPNPPAPKALNISTRMRVETGDNAMIAGFIITGSQPKRVIVRGIGPSLSFGGVLANPTLELDGGAVTNDDWRSTQEQEIIASTIPPASDLESAIVATLDPGPHTAILRGKDGGTGVALVEVYDLERETPAQLGNISSRGLVQTGNDVMIGGFIVSGDYPAKVIVRAIGPSLPLAGKLADPTLELFDSNGNSISNDNWRATQEAEIIATTVPPANDQESAIVAILTPGNYTAVVRGEGDTTGIAVVEAYNLE